MPRRLVSREAAPTDLACQYDHVRGHTAALCTPLGVEDYVIQSMPDVSPTRWHLAHTTWFFETFVLIPTLPQYQPFHPAYERLFNSYYNAVGDPFPRPRRGLLSRPTVADVMDYRAHVDTHMRELIGRLNPPYDAQLAATITIGLHHEQQHQELMLTDIKHVFSCNPLLPAYRPDAQRRQGIAPALRWQGYPEQVVTVGYAGDGFCYDNERPAHRTLIHPFEFASRLVTNGEFQGFMDDGGYRRPELWLADGWAAVQAENWQHPLYWRRDEQGWREFTLRGDEALDPDAPVCHVSYFEADAYARWADARLPTEFEWELAAREAGAPGAFVEAEVLHPAPAADGARGQMFGDAWEWTGSQYLPYPGYQPADGALGEYNGKFMCNQFVLRGGSCATARDHIRSTYRNFFPPQARWQFSGIRLAR